MTRTLFLVLISLTLAMAAPSSLFEGWRFAPSVSYSSDALLYNNGVAYVATEYYIYAVNSTNGWQMWNYSLGSYSFGSVAIKSGMIIFQNTQYLGAVNLMTGMLAWNISANSSSWSSYNQPLFISDTWAYAFVSTFGTRVVKVNLMTGASSDVYTSTSSYYKAQMMDGKIVMLNSNYVVMVNGTGAELWKTYMSYSPDYSYVAPGLTTNLVLVPSSSYIYAYNATDGTQVWRSGNSYSGNVRMIQPTMNATGGSNIAVVKGSQILLLDTMLGVEVYPALSSTTSSYTFYASTYCPQSNAIFTGDYYGKVSGASLQTLSWMWQNPTMYSDNNTPNFMYVMNGTLYLGIYYTVYTLDAMTGMVKTRFITDTTVYSVVWDPDDFGGSLLVLKSSGAVSVLFAGGNGTSFTFNTSPDSLVGIWNGVIYWGAGSVVSAVAFNGTSMWNTTVTGSFYRWKSYAPAFANGNVYFIEDSSTTETIHVFNAFTGAEIVTIDPSVTSTGCTTSTTYVDFDDTPVVDGTDLFFAASAMKVWMIKKDNSVSCFVTEGTVYNNPSTSLLLIYAIDNSQNRYAIAKLNMVKVWKVTQDITDVGTMTTPIFLDGDLYPGDNFGNVYCIGSTAGNKLWKASIDGSSSDTMRTWGFYGYVYAQNNNGKVASFEEGYLLLTSGHYSKKFLQNTPSSGDLGAPAISPDGVLVFANYYGVFAMYYNGTSIFNNTGFGTCSSKNLAVYMGVIYVLCDNRVRLLDLYSGKEWLRTQYNIDSFASVNNTVFLFRGSTVTTLSTGSAQLYTPKFLAAAHPPLPPRGYTPEELFEKSKLWIAGVIVGLIVIIIIVLVAKKLCGGGKKETDYVAMQSSGNTGV